jgi:hypothetical protein
MHADHGMEVIPADIMIKIYYSIRNKNTENFDNLTAGSTIS